jgi:hypothetical protein
MKEMQRIFFSLKQMFLATLLMMKNLFQILTKNNQFLMNIPVKMMKSKVEKNKFMASLEPCTMVPVYDNYEYDPWESHEGEKEELNVQCISCPTLVNEKISPRISQTTSILHPPVHSENVKQ